MVCDNDRGPGSRPALPQLIIGRKNPVKQIQRMRATSRVAFLATLFKKLKRGFLPLDVLLQYANGRTAATSGEIRGRPKNTFPILLSDVGPRQPKQSTGNAFEAIDQRRDGVFGWVVHNQVNLVCLAMHLRQLAFKISTDLLEDGFEPVESIGVKDLVPVLRHEDQMDMKLKTQCLPCRTSLGMGIDQTIQCAFAMSRPTCKYRLDPNRQQREEMPATRDACRELYQAPLPARREAWSS